MRKIAHWTETFTPGESIDILRDIALLHCEAAGPCADEIKRLIRRCDFKSVCGYSLDYTDSNISAAQFADCRQALALFSKLEDLDIGIDKEEAGWRKFIEAEEQCASTNEIFRLRARGEFCFSPRVESWLFKAQRKIALVLGPVPTFKQLGYKFGKGATTLTKKRLASIRRKFADGVSCSEDLVPAASAVLGELPHLCEAWCTSYTRVKDEPVSVPRFADGTFDEKAIALISDNWSRFESVFLENGIVRGDSNCLQAGCYVYQDTEWYSVPIVVHDGRLEFVPKNATIYRCTLTEPVLNGLLQLAVGEWMGGILAAFGQSIRDQTRNQILAREGSLTGELATLDLTSASDMKARELVFNLLPLDWASFIARARTSHMTYRGKRYTLEKFSGMGNGITFPLETLIFWSLACAVCEKDETVSVYGDDIILPSRRFEDLCELLTAVGFQPNKKKSFHTGPFRESCGHDYLSGINIRPYYQKEWVSGRTLFTLHNFYKRRGNEVMAEYVKTFIHPDLIIYGPDGYGDGHLLGEHPRKRKPSFDRRGYAGYLFSTFSVRPRKDIRPGKNDFVLPSYSIYAREGQHEGSFDPRIMLDSDACTGAGQVMDRLKFFTKWSRGVGDLRETLPLSETIGEEGEVVKCVDLPLRDEEDPYKRYTIYTLG